MTKQEARDYLAELEKAQPGITTKVFGMPFNPWTIRGEVLGEWGPPDDFGNGSHGLYQLTPTPLLGELRRRAFDPVANARAALRLARRT